MGVLHYARHAVGMEANDNLKSLRKLKYILLNTVGGGGNLLLNIGPRPDGRIEHRQIVELKKLGNWLKKYGNSIYGTEGGPYLPTKIFVSTRKGHKIYLHLLQDPGEHWQLPFPEDVEIEYARFMKSQEPIDIQRMHGKIQLSLPDKISEPLNTVIVLKINKKASKLETIKGYN